MSLAQIPPHDALVSRLSRYIRLFDRDIRALANSTKSRKRFAAHTDIVSEGDAPRSGFVLVDGMACRYRTMSDGRRQILGFIVPGDLCDLHASLLKRLDHSIGTIVPTSIATIGRELLDATMAQHPRIAAAMRWSMLQEAAMQREHLVALGRRNAHERVAYLICDLVWRHAVGSEGEADPIPLPLTQTDMADALGLTPIHVNRVLQEFRKDRLIVLERRHLRILEMQRLMRRADLTEDYLHLDGAPAEVERACARQERRRSGRASAADG
jgi:CRP-like cAMP-binding protein